jgi:ankyrin repeat protein
MLSRVLPKFTGRAGESIRQAVEDGYWELVQLLLLTGAELPGRFDLDRTALHVAAANGDAGCVRVLLEAGMDLESRDYAGNTPLLLACARACADADVDAHLDVLRLLLAAGANAAAVNQEGRTGLHAVDRNTPPASIATELLQASSRATKRLVNTADAEGNTPLHAALRVNHVELVRVLLAAGADPNMPDPEGKAPFGLCAEPVAFRLLAAAGGGPKQAQGKSAQAAANAVLWLASYGGEKVFRLALADAAAGGGDLGRMRGKDGETVLHRVCWADQSEDATRVASALAAGVDPNAKDNNRVTPLMTAARYGTAAAVRRLLDAGAFPAAVDGQGHTASAHAQMAGRWDLAELLSV